MGFNSAFKGLRTRYIHVKVVSVKTEVTSLGSSHVSIAASVPPTSADYLHDEPVREVAEEEWRYAF
jgi:hypothetical protein